MKVAVVGLDGATWNLLDPWLADLPTIGRFADSVRVELSSSIPPLSIPAWKCYTTGMDPGDLGVFNFVEPDFEAGRFNTVRSETFTHREIWDYLGDAGYRSAAINVPGTSPPREIDGWMVSGPFSEPDDFARPRDLQESLMEDSYDVLPDYYLTRDPADLDDAIRSIRGKFDVALEYSDRADFLHVTTYVTDTVQHTEWDSATCRSFWEDVDRELGRFVDELGPEWNVVLMSDHGFGETAGVFHLNTWLAEGGYLNLRRSGFDFGDLAGLLGLDYASTKKLLQRLNLAGPIRSLLPSEFLVTVARQMPGNRKLEGMQDRIDWDSDAVGAAPLVYTRDAETADTIERKLLEVRDHNGDPVIEEIYRGEELYPHCEVRTPDLVLKYGEYLPSDVESDQVMAYDEEWPGHNVAHHRPNGLVAALGPDVDERPLADASLCDLAPTILDAFGLDVPSAMRGESLGLLGENGRQRDVPVRRDVSRVATHDENVEQKLKDLGYI